MDNKSIKKPESNPDFKKNFQFDENIVTKNISNDTQNTSKPKENEKLVIIGGGLNDKPLSKKDVEALAKLPSLDDLKGKLIGLLQAPASNLARITKEPATKVLRTISAKSKQ